MARARNIKPGFFSNENLAECSPLARLLFAGLWCWADRAGRLECRPKRLKAEILPYDNCDVGALLAELETWGFLTLYATRGYRFIQVLNFGKHQNPHVKEAESTIPAPDSHQIPANDDEDETPGESGASTGQEPDEHQSGDGQAPPIPERARLIPSSLIPHPESSGERASAPQARGTRLSKDWVLPDDWLAEGTRARSEGGLPAVDLVAESAKFRDYWFAQAGAKGVKLDWLATWRNWARNAWAPRGNGSQPSRLKTPTAEDHAADKGMFA